MKKVNYANRNKFLFQVFFSDTKTFEFYAKSFTFGGLTLSTINVATPVRMYEIPGESYQAEDMVVDFNIDEDWVNYREIFKWMRRLKNPKSGNVDVKAICDAKITVLNSKFREIFSISIIDIFPISLTTLTLDTDDDGTPLLGQCLFKVNQMDIED
jgi:hypothetical protein